MRYNKKSVTVVPDDGHRWNVSPSFLRPVEPRDIAPTGEASANVVPFKK